MRRIHFLAEDIHKVEQVSDLLHQQGVDDWHFHVVSNDPNHLSKHHIQAANFFQKTELINGFLIGMGLMFSLSFFTLGLFTELGYFIDGERVVAWPYILIMMVTGAILGAIIGINLESRHLKRYHDAVNNGMYLMMIDVPEDKVSFIKHMIKKRQSAEYQEDFEIHLSPTH